MEYQAKFKIFRNVELFTKIFYLWTAANCKKARCLKSRVTGFLAGLFYLFEVGVEGMPVVQIVRIRPKWALKDTENTEINCFRNSRHGQRWLTLIPDMVRGGSHWFQTRTEVAHADSRHGQRWIELIPDIVRGGSSWFQTWSEVAHTDSRHGQRWLQLIPDMVRDESNSFHTWSEVAESDSRHGQRCLNLIHLTFTLRSTF